MEKTKISFYYLGKIHPLYLQADNSIKKTTIEFDGKIFICRCLNTEDVDFTDALKAFYTKASRKLIEERLKFYQPQFKVKYKSFSIEDDMRKWGSCNSNRYLTFNWKLLIFPVSTIDYVVIHEMCHLIHMNHDRSFWRLVGKFCPNYKEEMKTLGTEKTKDL